MALRWHRVYGDQVADGRSQNYLVTKYEYGWELFYKLHGDLHPVCVPDGPWKRMRDAKAKAAEVEAAIDSATKNVATILAFEEVEGSHISKPLADRLAVEVIQSLQQAGHL